MDTNKVNETREYGIDILRVLSIFMVIILHLLGHGGVLEGVKRDSANYYVAWFMEAAAFGAVNIFAMISGYLMIKKRFKLSRIISFWLQVFFYSLVIYVIGATIFKKEFSIKAFMPVTFKQYWYFSAYFALSFLMPFLNKLLNMLNKRDYSILVVILFILFSCISFVDDTFNIGGGYSIIWLCVMYIFGGYIYNYGKYIKISKLLLILIYFGSVALTLLSRYLIPFVPSKLYWKENMIGVLYSYVSPTIVLASVALIMLFAKIKVSKPIGKIFAFLSPLSFGIYLIHEHPLIRKYIILTSLSKYANINGLLLVVLVIGCALAIYLACGIIEYLRTLLFKLTRIDKLTNKIGQSIQKFIIKIFDKE